MTTGPTTVTYSYPSCRECDYTALIVSKEGVHMRVCDRDNNIIPPIKVDGKVWYYIALTDMTPNDTTPFWCPLKEK